MFLNVSTHFYYIFQKYPIFVKGVQKMYEFYEQLLQERGLTNYKVAKDTGIAQSVLSAWKNGTSTPKADKIKTLAEYFDVPVEFFDNGKLNVHKSASGTEYYFDDQTAKLAQELRKNPDMNAFMSSTRKLTPEQFNLIKETIKQFLKEDGIEV